MSDPISVFYLYRQRLPAFAPQALQIVSNGHALACAGAHVHILADRPFHGTPPTVPLLLSTYGLAPHHGFHLAWLPHRNRALTGLRYRALLLKGLLRARASGARPVVFSRRVDYAARLLRWRERLGLNVTVVHEWHYVASVNALEAGKPASARSLARDEATVLARADGHIAISRALSAYLECHHPPRAPLLVLPNGGPPPSDQPDFRHIPDAAPIRVLYSGLFRRPRDLEPLIRAAAHLPARIDLVVVGGDESGDRLAETQAMARDTGMAKRFRFAGPQSAMEARAALKTAAVAVATFADSMNMRHFACPLKILEYQAAGVPLVATDLPTVRELVQHGETGLLVPAADPAALARAVCHLIRDRALASRLSRQALHLARHRTWLQRGKRLLEFLESVSRRATE